MRSNCARGACCCAARWQPARPMRRHRSLLHSERSLYREVLVYETGSVRCMCFTRHCRIGRQSCQDVKRPDRIVMNYPQMMLGALFVEPEPRSVLIIGLGGGTIPRALRELLPQARIDVVEIDPAVVQRRAPLFRFRATASSCKVIEADGRVLREARAARAAALRPDHARCVRSRIHSRASADAGVPARGEDRCWRPAACWRPTRSHPAGSTITSRRPMRRCFRSSSI